MVTHMKTTIEIADDVLQAARQAAREDGTTLRRLVEDGLRRVLDERSSRVPFQLRDASFHGRGVQPGIRLDDWSRIREIIYEGRGA